MWGGDVTQWSKSYGVTLQCIPNSLTFSCLWSDWNMELAPLYLAPDQIWIRGFWLMVQCLDKAFRPKIAWVTLWSEPSGVIVEGGDHHKTLKSTKPHHELWNEMTLEEIQVKVMQKTLPKKPSSMHCWQVCADHGWADGGLFCKATRTQSTWGMQAIVFWRGQTSHCDD